MAQLAIKGNPTRGSEVIALLEMLGGNNKTKWNGDDESAMYFINENGNIKSEDIDYSIMKIFTIEAFLEKFPYKVGDKVLYKIYGIYSKIKSMLWNKEKEQVFYRLESNKLFVATTDELKPIYPYKVETMEGKVESFEILESHCADEVKIEFDPFKFEIVERDNGYYVVKKKTQYPNTYEECCEVLSYEPDRQTVTGYDAELIENLQTLKLCRDAYWKIAGDWKPNLDSKQHKLAISNVGNKISFEVYGEYNSILAFPTEEMRDAFYENFKDLINEVKELL